jgi:uncharacterized membrane protein
MAIHWQGRMLRPITATGVVIGTMLFAASLTPTLLPRSFVMQGVLCGVSFAIGYLIGSALQSLWAYLELPEPRFDNHRGIRFILALTCLIIIVGFLWQTAQWQNSIRSLMQLAPVDSGHPTKTGVIAIGVAMGILFLARLFLLLRHVLAYRGQRFLPRRVAAALSIALAVALSWFIVTGVIFDYGVKLADSSLKRVDALIEPDVEKPSDPLKTGSAQSLIAWEKLGRRGREYIASGPTAREISAFTQRDAIEPIRVYAGLNSAPTAVARAKLAVDELIRSGGFERKILLIISPTGTGWVDPEAVNTIEYLHDGDIASVAVQYSYLTSYLALYTDPDYGVENSRALFEQVYHHWTGLPKDSRPKLYLFGVSLGALNAQKSVDLYDVLSDPFQGALWSGPPASSPTWAMATNGRVEGTPVWLPRFRDSSIIRFANQYQSAKMEDATWGPMRIVYLQYASDPITFFRPSVFFRRPEWLDSPRGQDVSQSLRWFPIVTALQLMIDLANSTNAPMGYGHLYAPEHYIDAWVEVTSPDAWSEADITRLKAYFKDQRINP